MSLKIIRNDITKVEADAIVNTANEYPLIGDGCDRAIYAAAGEEKLLEARKKIGVLAEGEAAVTPAFDLNAKYIIHAVSPFYIEDDEEVEGRLRNCYRNSLKLAVEYGCHSIAFPLIATGSYGYPKAEGLRIAIDEINAFLISHDIEVVLVVFSDSVTNMARHIAPDLESYIDEHYIARKVRDEYIADGMAAMSVELNPSYGRRKKNEHHLGNLFSGAAPGKPKRAKKKSSKGALRSEPVEVAAPVEREMGFFDEETDGSAIARRMEHLSDTFSEYLMYLIEEKGLKNSDVYKEALVNKKLFSKIKNNRDYQPNKMTAMCLCVGARLNLDEAKDLLARAGYALSPANKTDIIFSYFLEHGIYDMLELDIQLEEHGEKCLIA